jgi:hypothetical protein
MATGATGTAGLLVFGGSSANFGTADPIATDATLVKPGFAALVAAAAAAVTAALAGLVAAAFVVGFGVSTEEALVKRSLGWKLWRAILNWWSST